MHTHITLETGLGHELTFEVEFDYDRGEKAVHYPNDVAHPGSPPCVEPTKATLLNPPLSKDWIQSAERWFWERYDRDPEAIDDQLFESMEE